MRIISPIYNKLIFKVEKQTTIISNIISMVDTDRFIFFWGETLPNHYSRTIVYDKTTQKSKYIMGHPQKSVNVLPEQDIQTLHKKIIYIILL
jgi:hypothetical protein